MSGANGRRRARLQAAGTRGENDGEARFEPAAGGDRAAHAQAA